VASSGNISLTDAQGNAVALESTGGLSVGKASIGVVVADGTTTVAKLSTAINALDMGISALALDVGPDDGPSSLVLSSRSTGADHSLTADFSHLSGFDGHPLNELRAAQDARLLLGDGTTEVTRAANSISDLLPGVTINLMYSDPNSPVTVDVGRDDESLVSGIKTMVEALNGAVNAVKRNVAYDATTKTAATLNGDTRAQIVTDRLRSAVQSSVAGNEIGRLGQLGIAITAGGVYQLDERKLREAISKDRDAVTRLLAGDSLVPGSGVMTKVAYAVKQLTTGAGPVASAVDGSRQSAAALDQALADEDRRLALVEERIRRKYTTLESTLANLSSQASGLTQALAG
jgi:flagellar hook-associated protein 2